MVQVKICMAGFTINLVTQVAVGLPVYIYIQEREVAILFFFHSELYILMQTIEVFQEFCESFLPVLPNHKGVIHVSVPALRFVRCQFYGSFFEFFHVEVCYHRGEWRAHCYSIRLFKELSIETE